RAARSAMAEGEGMKRGDPSPSSSPRQLFGVARGSGLPRTRAMVGDALRRERASGGTMDETADERKPHLILRPGLVAHGEWLARGRQGEGQLRASDVRLGPELRSADLRYADFEGCDFRKADLREARMDGARFRDCLFEGADLRRASAIDARFEAC